MSNADTPPAASEPPPVPAPPGPPPEQRHGCLTAFMVIAGVIMLLPGLCSVLMVFVGVATSTSDFQFAAGSVLVGCIGVAVIWSALRRRRS